MENIRLQFDKLVRSLGSDGIGKNIELGDHIKPIMVLIPAYCEEENLRELRPKIPKQIEGLGVGVLVIDDGSEDETFSVADESEGVFVVKNPINRGGGAALRLGYDIIKKAGSRLCITMDADCQHQP